MVISVAAVKDILSIIYKMNTHLAGVKRFYLNFVKNIYEKTITIIMVNDQNLNLFLYEYE